MTNVRHVHLRVMILAIVAVWTLGSWDRRRLESAEPGLPPAVGDQAPDFKLNTLDHESVELSKLRQSGPVVLIVLRGYPGYQCPVCNTQVGQFLAGATKLAAANANVVLVYPGDADGLQKHASEFIRGKTLPVNVFLALDPDFKFTLPYQLRWNAKNETAYPATFVVDSDGKVRFAKVSKTHGGRASLDEVLKALDQ
jgi:peroxiredoxin Q/BCP